MIESLVLARVFDGEDIAGVLHKANYAAVSTGTAAGDANGFIGDVVALGTVLGEGAQLHEGIGNGERGALVFLKQKEGETQGGFFSDAGQAGNFVDGFFDQFGGKLHKRD